MQPVKYRSYGMFNRHLIWAYKSEQHDALVRKVSATLKKMT